MALTAVLVGCGAMSKGWLEVLTSGAMKDRVRIVGLSDLDRGAAEARRREFAIDAKAGEDLAELLHDTKPDVVFDVVVPAARHEVVAASLARGCHVLSEKPMAATMTQARDLVSRARLAGRLHVVMQNRRYNEGVRRMRASIAAGVIGEITAIHCDFFVGAHFGGFREQMEDVLLLDMAIHTLDAARFVSGKTPRAVYCHESNPKGSWWAHGAVANAIFEMGDDVVFTYRGSWAAEGANTGWDSSWRLIGTKGTILWDGADGLEGRVVAGTEGLLRPTVPIDLPTADPRQTRGHASVIAAFLDAVENGATAETDGTDNIKSLAMVFAAVESARSRQRVEVRV